MVKAKFFLLQLKPMTSCHLVSLHRDVFITFLLAEIVWVFQDSCHISSQFSPSQTQVFYTSAHSCCFPLAPSNWLTSCWKWGAQHQTESPSQGLTNCSVDKLQHSCLYILILCLLFPPRKKHLLICQHFACSWHKANNHMSCKPGKNQTIDLFWQNAAKFQ